jgi:hypothetical protein
MVTDQGRRQGERRRLRERRHAHRESIRRDGVVEPFFRSNARPLNSSSSADVASSGVPARSKWGSARRSGLRQLEVSPANLRLLADRGVIAS